VRSHTKKSNVAIAALGLQTSGVARVLLQVLRFPAALKFEKLEESRLDLAQVTVAKPKAKLPRILPLLMVIAAVVIIASKTLSHEPEVSQAKIVKSVAPTKMRTHAIEVASHNLL